LALVVAAKQEKCFVLCALASLLWSTNQMKNFVSDFVLIRLMMPIGNVTTALFNLLVLLEL
jgi:hypothetical protein